MIGPNPLLQIDIAEQAAVALVATTHRRLRFTDIERITTAQSRQRISATCEMSQSSWLTAGLVPGVDRRPLKKLGPDATGSGSRDGCVLIPMKPPRHSDLMAPGIPT